MARDPRPLLGTARLGLKEMGDRKTGAQCCTMTPIEGHELVARTVLKFLPYTPCNVLADPSCPKALAFKRKESDLVKWIDRTQAPIEFDAVNDANWIAKPDVLGPQVAVTIDNLSATDAFGEQV